MAQYYIDTSSTGSGDGTTTATSGANAAWAAFSEITGEAAGDIISLNKDDTWREQLTVGTSGSVGSPITFNAYGSGADPIIKGSDTVSTWTEYIGAWAEIWTAESQINASTWTYDSAGTDKNYRFWIKNAYITQSATTIRLKFKGHNTNDLLVEDLAIGPKGDGVGEDLFDYEGNVAGTNVQQGSSDSWTLSTGTSEYTDSMTFTIDSGTDYLVAINVPNPHRRSILTSGNPNNYYHKTTADDETETGDVTGYALGNALIWIESIEGRTPQANTWQATLTTEPNQVFFDGTRGTLVADAASVNSENEWFWEANVLYIYYTEDPDDAVVIEAKQRPYCIYGTGINYITVDGIDCRQATHGIGADGTNWTVQNNILRDNYYFGVRANGTVSACDDWLIDTNTVHGNGATGIAVLTDADGCTISSNTVYNNCQLAEVADHNYSGGIRLSANVALTNNVIESNTVYSNGYGGTTGASGTQRGSGIWTDTVGAGNIIRYNNIYSNYYTGMKIDFDSNGTQIYYNLIHDHVEDDNAGYGAGISVDGLADGTKLYNNVCYKNRYGLSLAGQFPAQADDMQNMAVRNNISFANTVSELRATRGSENDGTNGYDNVYTHNCLGVEAANFIEWGQGIYKATYDTWETAYGATTASVEADPLMTDPDNNDFTLQTTSLCINAGVDISLTVDYSGEAVAPPPDIGAYETDIGSMGGGVGMTMFMGLGLK